MYIYRGSFENNVKSSIAFSTNNGTTALTDVMETAADIQQKCNDRADGNVRNEAGEYVVSELARQWLLSQMSHLHIPLAKLLGMKISVQFVLESS